MITLELVVSLDSSFAVFGVSKQIAKSSKIRTGHNTVQLAKGTP